MTSLCPPWEWARRPGPHPPVAGAASGAQCPQLGGEGGSEPVPGTCHCCCCECPPEQVCLGVLIANLTQDQPPGGAVQGTREPRIWAGMLGGQRGCAGAWGMHEGMCALTSDLLSPPAAGEGTWLSVCIL